MEYLLLLVVLGICFFVYLTRGKAEFSTPDVSPISKADLRAFEAVPSLWVNASEAALFAILCRHMPPGFHVHGKVRLEDIIRVKRGLPEKLRWAARGRVKSRHIDYVIAKQSGQPVLAIELDGRSHDPKNPSEADKVKTALFKAANLKLRRIRVGDDFDHIVVTIVKELNGY